MHSKMFVSCKGGPDKGIGAFFNAYKSQFFTVLDLSHPKGKNTIANGTNECCFPEFKDCKVQGIFVA